jgi:hypothetical protein
MTKKNAAAFLDKNADKIQSKARQAFTLPDEVWEIIDEANRRRVGGESISLNRLIEILRREYNIKITVKTIAEHVKERIGRRIW